MVNSGYTATTQFIPLGNRAGGLIIRSPIEVEKYVRHVRHLPLEVQTSMSHPTGPGRDVQYKQNIPTSMQASIHQSSAWDQACLTQAWWDFMKRWDFTIVVKVINWYKLWSCFLLGLRRFGLLQPALWLGGRTRAIASSQRCPGVSYTHAWPMPLSIRLGLFWSNFWEKPEPPNGKTLYLGSHVSKKGQLFCPWNARWHLR